MHVLKLYLNVKLLSIEIEIYDELIIIKHPAKLIDIKNSQESDFVIPCQKNYIKIAKFLANCLFRLLLKLSPEIAITQKIFFCFVLNR